VITYYLVSWVTVIANGDQSMLTIIYGFI